MGLEVTELLMACEEEFGVDFEGHEREPNDIETVGDLHRCILSRLTQSQTRNCPNVPVYFSLREALVINMPIVESTIRPDTKLLDLLSSVEWVRIWPALRKSVVYELPSPHAYRSISPTAGVLIRVGLLGAILSGLLLTAVLSVDLGWHWHTLIALAAITVPLVGLFAAGSLARPPIKYRLPAETFGELVGRVVRSNHRGLSSVGIPWNSESVWLHLRHMIASRFDVEEARIVPETDFFRDLGAG